MPPDTTSSPLLTLRPRPAILGAFGLLLAVIVGGVTWRMSPERAPLLLALGVPMGAIALAMLTYHVTLTAEAIHSKLLGFKRTIPLKDVSEARVQVLRGSRGEKRHVLLLRGPEQSLAISLGFFSRAAIARLLTALQSPAPHVRLDADAEKLRQACYPQLP